MYSVPSESGMAGPIEDQEAGFAGAPFVQPAHDEEWMEYIDWGEVEAQAGGSSSSGA